MALRRQQRAVGVDSDLPDFGGEAAVGSDDESDSRSLNLYFNPVTTYASDKVRW